MNDIIGHGGGKGGGSSHTHYEAPDSLHSTSYARVLDLVSEGEILGLAKGIESVFLNGTPVQNADGTSNFAGVTVDFRTGTQDQDFIPGFPDVESEVAVGVELKASTPWVRAISNTTLSAVRITLGVDQLYKADTTNGDVGGARVDYQIDLATDGGPYQTVLTNSFNGKTMSAYQRSARIDLPRATTGWQVRVSRMTPDSAVVNIVDKTRIISFTEVIDAKLRYPMSAIVGLQVDAKAFQSVPTRAYEMFGRIIQVPSNYNPLTRVYTGVWDGTFKPAWSDNPAWVFRDLALHVRYGLGDRITPAQLDKWALYRIAQYCDQVVPNGKGGTEPRFTCNLYLQTRKQAYAVLQDIASIFRGISYWGGGTIIASADMPSDPVYVYTAANVIGGKFSRAGSGKGTRYTTAVVTWNDPADFYKPKVEYVEDPEGIKRYGIQQTELTAFGCTSQGQAQRAGRWALATSRLETEALSFDVGMDGAIALPGQIVRIADPARMGRRAGGRIHSAAGRIVVLDKAPVIQTGDNLTVILPTGKSETRAVASVAGDSVTVNADWSVVPLAQSVWSVDSTELSAPLFRVLSVREKDETTFSIAAIQHEPGKFGFVESGTAISPRTQTALDVSRQAPPTSVTLVGYTVSLADVQRLALQVSCAPVAGAVAYEGAYRRGNDNWVAIPRQASPTLDVQDVLPGSFVAKMAAVNSIGVTSVETLSVAVEITKDGVSKNADVLLTSDAPSFHTNQAGDTAPGVITFYASLIALEGPVDWSCVGGTLTNTTATTAQLTFSNMSAASAEVTASVTAFGRTYSRPLKVRKTRDGAQGADGLKTQVARLFQWAPVAPAKPVGVSTFIWASLTNSGYTGQDGWADPAPANPGTPGWRLFSAAVPLSAAVAATTSPVTYTSAIIEDGVQNGAAGQNGLQAYEVAVYQWAATIPAAPVGAGTLTWNGYAFGAAPANWTLTPGDSPSPGYTLWKAGVRVSDTAAATSTGFTWSTAAITVAGSAGATGAAGTAMYVDISTAGGQVFARATAADAFAPTSITLTATPYGGAASAHQWQYWTGAAWSNIAGATGSTYAVGSGTFTAARVFRVQSTIAGTVYTDEITLVQVTGGKDGLRGDDAIVGFLTNESTTLAASSSGVVSSFSTAGGTFKVYQGTADKTGSGVTYSVFSESGCDLSITAAGAYTVESMSADQAAATLQAVYGGVTIQKQVSLSKARAGTSITGAEGASYVTAYCASASVSTSTAPQATAGRNSVPVNNDGGVTGTWAKPVPVLADNQRMWQTDGIYNPANDTVTWSIPYISSAKYGSLSAIVANLGQITGGSLDIGTGSTSWHVDASGNQWSGAGTFGSAPWRVANSGAVFAKNLSLRSLTDVEIVSPVTGLQPGFEAPGTKNSEAVAAAATDAQTRADAARIAAENAAATYAQAQAGLAATNAAAYADGKVTAAEQRAINDASTKAEAARVAAISAAAADAAAKDALIRVGGRNLYKKTASFSILTSGSSLVSLNSNGFVIAGVNANNGTMRLNGIVTENGDYTISFKLRILSVGNFPLTIDVCDGYGGPEWTFTPTDKSVYYEKTFKVNGITDFNVYNFVDFNGLSGQNYYFDDFKIEKGNKATGWSPAPEDVAADTAAAKTAADAANQRLAYIGADNKLSREDKIQTINEFVLAGTGFNDLIAKAATAGVPSTDYYNAKVALNNYLAPLIGAGYNDTSTDSDIDGAVYRAKFVDVYNQKDFLINAIAAKAATTASANNISGMTHFRVLTQGNARTAPMPAGGQGLYRNGGLLYGCARSYMMLRIRRSDAAITSFDVYDVWNDAGRAAALAADLNATTPDFIVVVYTYDEPATNHLYGALASAMYRCGATPAVYGAMKICGAYCLIGIPGCGQGGGAEFYAGAVNQDPNAWIDVAFQVVNGTYVVSGEFSPDLTDKLSKSGNDVITGTIGLQSQYAILVGNPNDGVFIGSTGIYARKGGYTQLSLGSDGTALYGGGLVAVYGTFGDLRIASGGAIASGNYYASRGYAWPEPSEGGGLFINQTGMLFGNARNPSVGYFQVDVNGTVLAPGFRLENRQLTLDNPVIVSPTVNNPKITQSFSASMSDVRNLGVATGTVDTYIGVSLSGGSGDYSYTWTISGALIDLVSSPGAATAVVRTTGSNNTWRYGFASVTVRDRQTGLSAVADCSIAIQHGSGAEP